MTVPWCSTAVASYFLALNRKSKVEVINFKGLCFELHHLNNHFKAYAARESLILQMGDVDDQTGHL